MLGLELTEPWMLDAACIGTAEIGEDPDLFFPNRDTDKKVAVAKAICATCDVRTDCFDYGMRTHSVGIWGGTTGPERATIRRELRNPRDRS